jgi:ferric-dicitrate binding protein FerR (iron transport regulator)
VDSGQPEPEVKSSTDASTAAKEVGTGQPVQDVTPPIAEQATSSPAPIAKQGKLDFVAPKPVENQPVANQPKIVQLQPNWQRWAAIAAAVLLGVVGLWWMTRDGGRVFGEDQSIATKAGEKREVELPDGSTAMLNALSSLDFSPKTWGEDRYVLLEGEAFFKAKKGKTFSVKTEQGTVEVVGTVFNVYARGEELEVKCAEGKVQVINPESTERILLKKGEQVTVLRGRMQKRQGLEGYPNWFKGESAFRSAPLERVFGEMERQYGVKVLADSLGGRTFTGKFVHSDLQKAVKMVCAPMKLNCEVRGDTVFVH